MGPQLEKYLSKRLRPVNPPSKSVSGSLFIQFYLILALARAKRNTATFIMGSTDDIIRLSFDRIGDSQEYLISGTLQEVRYYLKARFERWSNTTHFFDETGDEFGRVYHDSDRRVAFSPSWSPVSVQQWFPYKDEKSRYDQIFRPPHVPASDS